MALPISPFYPTHLGGGGVSLSGLSGIGVGFSAWSGTEKSFSVVSRLSFFLPAWKRIMLDQFVLKVGGHGYSFPSVQGLPLALTPVETQLPRLQCKWEAL